MGVSLDARDPDYAASTTRAGGEKGHKRMAEDVVAEKVGAEDLAEGWRGVLGRRAGWRKLRSGGIPNTTELEGRVCDFKGKIGHDGPDCLGPIDAYESAVSCIENDGLEFGERGEQLSGEGLHGEEGG